MHWLLVGAAETPDLSALQSALQSLRSSPGIATAAMSPQVSFDALRPGTAIDGWTWDSTAVTSAGAPLGRDGSWGYTTSV
jgi:outer membrane protein TolC